jgi:catechol 2,3-dioxygenase-like lactoylglutathione lyase family enzyme
MRCSLYFVELTVRELARSLAWYSDVLGLEVLLHDEGRRWVMLAAGRARLALKEGEMAEGGTLVAFEVDDLAAWVKRLRAKGVETEGESATSAEGYRRMRLRDPDGHAISLFEWGAGGEPVG